MVGFMFFIFGTVDKWLCAHACVCVYVCVKYQISYFVVVDEPTNNI